VFFEELDFHARRQFLGEIVHLHGQHAEVMDQPVVAEHGRDGDHEAGDRGDQGARRRRVPSSGGRGADIARATPPKASMTPQTVPSKSEKRGAADGDGEEDQGRLPAAGPRERHFVPGRP
jgi:hypothetical protein